MAACLLAASGGPSAPVLPEAVRTRIRPAIERPGWFIDKASVASASAPETYDLARGGALPIVAHDEGSAAAAAVSLGRWLAASPGKPHDSGTSPVISTSPADYGRAISPTSRPGFDLAPVMVTWPVSVFLALLRGRTVPKFIVVPRAWLGQFHDQLERGQLDRAIKLDLTSNKPGRIARDWRDAWLPAVFDAVPSRHALLPPEPM